MNGKFLILAMFLCLTVYGCDGTTSVDQCKRERIFMECLKASSYEVDGDVVKECGSQSYYLSVRNIDLIEDECKTY